MMAVNLKCTFKCQNFVVAFKVGVVSLANENQRIRQFTDRIETVY